MCAEQCNNKTFDIKCEKTQNIRSFFVCFNRLFAHFL